MRLSTLTVRNFRSIAAIEEVRIEPLQALVGENNCGKSNTLRAIRCFLTAGAGGVEFSDFRDPAEPIVVECTFSGLSDFERRRLRPYLLGGTVLLRKELRVTRDEARGKVSVKAEYHGYQAEPRTVAFSMRKIEEQEGRSDWAALAEAAGFLESARLPDGRVTKSSYVAALKSYLDVHDVEYDEPVLGETHALGISPNLLAVLPQFYLLPAITDYSTEIDRRSSTSVFRQLMADLSNRLIRADPRYGEIEAALSTVRGLLNQTEGAGGPRRLAALEGVETDLRDIARGLMPSIRSISLAVEVEDPKDLFARGVAIKVDDGVLTDLLDKGHGMQRSLVFALLQMLIRAADTAIDQQEARPIILAIEEPELYIHPHSQRLIFGVLKRFAGLAADGQFLGSDQVIYTTHAPAFIDMCDYQRIGVVRKPDSVLGTAVQQCAIGVLGNPGERATFKMLTSFRLAHNEVLFARLAVLVEGEEDAIAVIATARKLGRIVEFPDEIGLSIVVVDGKGELPKFQKILNAFGFSYGVLLELDGRAPAHHENAPILENLNGNRLATLPRTLENTVRLGRQHFRDVLDAKTFFSQPANITEELENAVRQLLPPH
jgi:putative ATP-dependent endonuclease of the OLD family